MLLRREIEDNAYANLGGGGGGGQIKVKCGRFAGANECILREVQLLENMLIEDIKLWGVEEAADNSAKKR